MTMTEETQQSEAPAQNEAQVSSPDVGKSRDNKKEKCRPMTKVVIRRLPPTMSQDQFLEQVSPLPEHDYLYYVKADMSLGQFAFSRAYINFIEPQDIFTFREKFDNYVFVDSKGIEYPAVVEFAPFQRLPKKRVGKKKDSKCGTIESDPYYISFLESLKNQEADSTVAQPKTEYSYQPSDSTPKKVTTTPLLEYLKQRKQEKQRLRDEKREERRRRDLERRRTKEDPIISKPIHCNEDDQIKCPFAPVSQNFESEHTFPKYFSKNSNASYKTREEVFRNELVNPPKQFRKSSFNTHQLPREDINNAELSIKYIKNITPLKDYTRCDTTSPELLYICERNYKWRDCYWRKKIYERQWNSINNYIHNEIKYRTPRRFCEKVCVPALKSSQSINVPESWRMQTPNTVLKSKSCGSVLSYRKLNSY